MDKVGMTTDRERRIWLRANMETRPMVPHSHADYLLKLHHLYFSDDSRNLIEIVHEKYRDDVDLFGYKFPTNETLAPWSKRIRSGAE